MLAPREMSPPPSDLSPPPQMSPLPSDLSPSPTDVSPHGYHPLWLVTPMENVNRPPLTCPSCAQRRRQQSTMAFVAKFPVPSLSTQPWGMYQALCTPQTPQVSDLAKAISRGSVNQSLSGQCGLLCRPATMPHMSFQSSGTNTFRGLRPGERVSRRNQHHTKPPLG